MYELKFAKQCNQCKTEKLQRLDSPMTRPRKKLTYKRNEWKEEESPEFFSLHFKTGKLRLFFSFPSRSGR